MRVVITSTGNTLDSPIDPRFGRCQFFIFVDSESEAFDAMENQAMMAPGGAGTQAAQFVANSGAKVVITGNVGPNAAATLNAGGIKILTGATGTVRETLNSFRNGQLQEVTDATVAAHSGMAGGRGQGMGGGMGRGMGPGMGQGGKRQ